MSVFACPACGARLERREKVYVCPNGHSYDIASERYVYLLPPNKKHSASPGDDKEMVSARRRFLGGGWYRIFSDALNELAVRILPAGPAVILDAGCGEGYYTERLCSFLAARRQGDELAGFDISKAAVKAAAKRCKGISLAVGSCFGIPVPSSSVDLLTNVFAPIVPDELARVVKPGGNIILAVPGERHLFGLKQILYDAPYENERKDTAYPGFEFRERVPVRGTLETRDPQVIADLFAMTPYAWKTPWEGRERLKKANFLQTELAFDFLVYQRT